MPMAVSATCNNSLLSPLGLTSKTLDSSSSSFFKPQFLCFQCRHHHHNRALLCKFTIGPSQLKVFPISKRSFKACSLPTDGAAENGRDRKPVSNLKNLFKIYREAIFYRDEKVISEIEARISIIESEKSELSEKVNDLSAELTSGKERYIRLQADFDNFRKRSEKERINVRNGAVGEVIESLLPMIDSFERARQHIKPETEREKSIDTSYQGIYKQFVEIMRSLKVAAVPTVGKPFDPSVHEAIAREESLEYKEGIVIQEFRRGFLLGDRLLRPATVKVSIGPGSKRATVGATESSGNPASAAGVE